MVKPGVMSGDSSWRGQMLWLYARALDEYDCGSYRAYLEIDDDGLQELFKKRDLWKLAKSKDDSLAFMDYWGGVEFIENVGNSEEIEALEEACWSDGPEYFITDKALMPSHDTARTECDRISVSDDGVFFKAYLKHSSVQVETPWVSWGFLETWAACIKATPA